jgi:hypothetical protein
MRREYSKFDIVAQAAGCRDGELLSRLEIALAMGQIDAPKRVIWEE